MTPEQLDAIEAACTDGIAQHRSSGVGEFTILSLVAAVRESERALETQKKVADTFRQCLTDTYRPHVEENKMLRDLISHYDPMLRERDNTIARVRAVLDDYDGLDAEPIPKLSTYTWMHEVRAALDPQETP